MKHEKISKKKNKNWAKPQKSKKRIKLKKMQKKWGEINEKQKGNDEYKYLRSNYKKKGEKHQKKAKKNSKRKKNETVVNLDPKESARSPNRLHMPEITKMNTSSHFRGHLKYMSIYVNQTIDEALLKPSAPQNHYLKPSKNLPQKIKLLESIIS